MVAKVGSDFVTSPAGSTRRTQATTVLLVDVEAGAAAMQHVHRRVSPKAPRTGRHRGEGALCSTCSRPSDAVGDKFGFARCLRQADTRARSTS